MAKRAGAPLGNLNRLKGSMNKRFITQALVMKLMEEVTDPREAATPLMKKAKARRLDFLVDTMVTMALNGDVQMIKYVVDRVEGLATQTMQFEYMKEGEEKDKAVAAVTLDKLNSMPVEDVTALYRQKILETHEARGTA